MRLFLFPILRRAVATDSSASCAGQFLARFFATSRYWLAAGCALLVLAGVSPAQAQITRNFTIRYSANVNGDFAAIGNTVTYCDLTAGNASCNGAPSGSSIDNQSVGTIINVDVDGDAVTFNSSSANLSVPSGSTVRFAGLYWGGRSTSLSRGQILFRTPTSFGYSPVSANVIDTASGASNNYAAFADVTAAVAAAGNGTYFVGNIQTYTGLNGSTFNNSGANCRNLDGDSCWGGWSLVVVYENATMGLRNIAIYDGYALVTGSPGVVIPVSGFLTPLSGPVSTRVGTVGWDGDRGLVGDQFFINGTAISDANNPANDFYNASISDLGVNATSRNPTHLNTLGTEIDRYTAPAGVISNGATSTTLQLTTGGEHYFPQMVAFSTDLYVPVVVPNLTKTVSDVNGGLLLPGDTLRYTVTFSNTGQDTAVDSTVLDNIPAGTSYVPGSLLVLPGSANAGAKTDVTGDDQAEYVGTGTPRVVFRVGTGASASQGGSVPFNASTSVQFDVTVNSGLSGGTEIINNVSIQYTGQTLGETLGTSKSQSTPTIVTVPPAISKSFAPNPIAPGGLSVLTIQISNAAGNPANANDVRFSDTYPAGLVNAASPNPQITCTPGSTPGTIVGGTAGGNSIGLNPGAILTPNGSCSITVNVTAAATGNYANTTSAVSSSNSGSGSTAGAVLSVGKPAVSKSFAPTGILVGGTSALTFVVNNPTTTNLSNVAFSDTLSGMVVANPNGLTGTCGGNVTATPGSGSVALANGVIAAGGNCTFSVNVTSTTAGIHPNTTTGVTSDQTGVAGNPSNTADLTVIAAPSATKSFSPASIAPNAFSLLTIVVNNTNSTVTANGVGFTDTYPAGLINATPANATLNCTSGSSATLVGGANGGNSLGISGGTLAPGGSCTVTVSITSASAATYNNSTGTIASSNTGNGASANASLNVTNLTVPTVAKTFVSSPIVVNGTSTLRITLTNANATSITGVTFSDLYPVGLTNAATPNATTTCPAGTITASAGGNSLLFTGGTVPASGSCRVDVAVTSPDAGHYFNSTGPVTTANAGASAGANAMLDVLTPPTVTKSFSPDTVAVNGDSQLRIVITNPAINSVSLTGINVNDDFPANMVVAPTAGLSNSCGGTLRDQGGSSTFSNPDTGFRLSGVTLAAGASCTLQFNVRSSVAGNRLNTTSQVAATGPIALTGSTGSATLSVGQPDITKVFSPATITVGQSSVLTITLTNPTGSNMTSAAFTDNYPSGLTNTSTPSAGGTCAGTRTAAANGISVSLSGGTIPANSSCTVTVNVTATGTAPNTIAASALTVSGGATNGSPTSATLTVTPPLAVTKSFSPNVIAQNGTSVLSITLTNPNAFNVTGVTFTDNYPANLLNTGTPNGIHNCGGGSVSAAANGTSVAFSSGIVTANSSCSVTVNTSSATGGVYNNSTGNVTTTNAGTASAAVGTLTVMTPPTVAKAFTPSSISLGDSSTLTITLTNPNATQAVTGVTFTDTYPVGMINASSMNANTSCSGGTVIAAPGGASVALTSGTIPAGGSCTVSIDVTSASANTYNNTTGAVTTSNAGTGAAANATLTVQPQPTIAKAFAPAAITAGAPSTLTITISNPRTAALSALSFNDAFPAGMVVHSTPALTNSCGGTVNGATGNSTSIGLTGGSLAAGANCAISVAVTANTIGTYNNTTSALTSNEAPPSAPSNTTSLSVAGFGISGVVYSDSNHNATRDNAEAGTGQSLFVKLASRSGASCTSPALVAATVNTTTGAYAIAPYPPGDYCLVLDTNSTLSDVTPGNAANWLNTEVANGNKAITITGANLIVQNFGLFNGSRLSGRVFNDNGIVAGVPNNGVQEGGEVGLASVAVRANNAGCPSTLCDTTLTDTLGNYTLWIPAAASGSVVVAQTNLGGYVSSGGSRGTTTGGAGYDRTADTTTFNLVAGSSYSGVDFADVPPNSFVADGAQSGLPGSTIGYPHTFTAGSGGAVSFSTSNIATPAIAGWTNTIYRDSNCDGAVQAAEATAPLSGATVLTAGQQICIVVREFIPAGAPSGARDQITVTAGFTYTNASPALSGNATRTDITSVGPSTSAGLHLTKTVDRTTALPGETLTYTITYTNTSSASLANIVIADTVPAFTVYVGGSAGCPGLIARTTCSVLSEPPANAIGALRWGINGNLGPSASGTVQFQVRVE